MCHFERAIVAAVCVLASALIPAAAQESYPSRPIQIIVGFTPGGGSDTVARVLGPDLSAELNVPVVIENKPGAGGVIATDYVAKAQPDGYTLLLASPGAYTIAVSLRTLPYDPVKDFTMIGQLTSYPNILVASTESGITSVSDLIRKAKANPGKLDFATSGIGTTPQLAVAYLGMLTGTNFTQIPHKGTPQALGEVLAGRIPLMIGDPPALMPHVETGKLRALAVTTKDRSPLFPSIPSMKEVGVPEFDVPFWHALTGPKGLPPEVVSRLGAALEKILARKQIDEKIEAAGMGVKFSSPAELSQKMADERARWANVIKVNNIKE